jgi:cell division protein ZapA
MSDVTLTIAGRGYTIACDPGQERHVTSLGRAIDEKLTALSGLAGQSETRTLLFAALLLADELHEARNGAGPAPATPQFADDGAADALETLAGRLEAIAERLESGVVSA